MQAQSPGSPQPIYRGAYLSGWLADPGRGPLAARDIHLNIRDLMLTMRFPETHRTAEYDRRYDSFTEKLTQLLSPEDMQAARSEKGDAFAANMALARVPAFRAALLGLSHFGRRCAASAEGEGHPGLPPITPIEVSRIAADLLRAQAELSRVFPFSAPEFFEQHAPAWCRTIGASHDLHRWSPDLSQGPLRSLQLPTVFRKEYNSWLIDHSSWAPPHPMQFWNLGANNNPLAMGALFALPLRAIADVALASGTSRQHVDNFVESTYEGLESMLDELKAGEYTVVRNSRNLFQDDPTFQQKWLQGVQLALTLPPQAGPTRPVPPSADN